MVKLRTLGSGDYFGLSRWGHYRKVGLRADVMMEAEVRAERPDYIILRALKLGEGARNAGGL